MSKQDKMFNELIELSRSLQPSTLWQNSHRGDRHVLPVADRHYNRQKPGSPQFVPPGRCVVFKHVIEGACNALWVTSWPFKQYVKHQWAGAWVNSMFRKECDGKASEFIRQAIAVTRFFWDDIPSLGMISFIDPKHVKPFKIRGRPTWGKSYLEAGFKHVGYTKGGLWCFQILPEDMPIPAIPIYTEKEVSGYE